MKSILYIALTGFGLFLAGCQNSLDLYPLAQPSAEKWYSNESEISLALNDLYRPDWWSPDEGIGSEVLSDDVFNRTTLSPIKAGTTNSQWGTSTLLWRNSYKAIARANRALAALDNPITKANVPPAKLAIYVAELKFHRAAQYARLITYFGDVVYSDAVISIEEAYTKGRTDKKTVLASVYKDFDEAAAVLPQNYPASALKRVTKGPLTPSKPELRCIWGILKWPLRLPKPAWIWPSIGCIQRMPAYLSRPLKTHPKLFLAYPDLLP
ncbi:RagB/SusD family nutrient uptake outer membrane protein [Spirosoma telluris]|uniref:RagB/SusD family nutrient uptake outer membrane protein n=1 Tax=Spirosoma telluris TaxID=2183553 RepID=UPI002FC29391